MTPMTQNNGVPAIREGLNEAVTNSVFEETPLLELVNISKRFGSTQALSGVSLTLKSGEILGLLGQNGSGKSTLVGILAGVHTPDPGGRIVYEGKDLRLPLQRGDRSLGIVPQDLGLAERLTVLENLTIGRRIAPKGGSQFRINWRSERKSAKEVLERYNVSLPLNAMVGELSLLQQALLAIIRCAEDLGGDSGRGVMILDEPTVFLPIQERDFLFELVNLHVKNGKSVIIISHDIGVIRELSQRVVVLRNGKVAGQAVMSDVTNRDLVDLIIGQ